MPIMRDLDDDQVQPEALFELSWLPKAPMASGAKEGPYRRRRRDTAAELPYVEVNPACLASLIVTDIDTTDIRELPQALGLPAPSWEVGRRADVATGHIGYALAAPVCLTDAGRRRPVNLLMRIERGICDVLGGDPHYAGRIMKNPLAPGDYQYALFNEEFPRYQLKELAAALDTIGALPAYDEPVPLVQTGIGRNVDLFEHTRRWAYRAIKRYWNDDFTLWSEVVYDHATIRNERFTDAGVPPLSTNEVQHLARSIAKWVWQRFTPQDFQTIQSRRGKKSGESRSMIAQKRWMKNVE